MFAYWLQINQLTLHNALHFCSVLDDDLVARTNDTDVSISLSQAEVEISTDHSVPLACNQNIYSVFLKEENLSQIKICIIIIINVCVVN